MRSELQWRRWLVLIALLASVARLAMILATPHFSLFGDPVDYQRHAVSIASGHGFPSTELATPGSPSAFRSPGYPYLLGGVYAVVGVHPDAGRAVGGLLGVLAVVLLALLGRALWGDRVGLLAGAIAAVFPPLVALDASLLSENLFVALELAFALSVVALAHRPDQLRRAAATGALCGLAALTRAVADTWVLVGLAVILIGPGAAALRWRSAAALVAALAAVLIPWTVRNLDALHALVPVTTEAGYTLAGQYNPAAASTKDGYLAVWRSPLLVASIEADVGPLFRRPGGVNEAQLDHALLDYGLRYFEHHPEHLLVASVLDTLRLVNLGTANAYTRSFNYREMAVPGGLQGLLNRTGQLLVGLALLVLLTRLARVRGARFSLGPWWLWGIPALTLALTVPMVGNPLKRAPLDPFFILLMAIGAVAVEGALRSRRAAPGRQSEPAPAAG